MAEAIEIPLQQPTGIGANVPPPAIETATQSTPTNTPQPTTTNGSDWSWVLWFVLGLAFLVAIVYIISAVFKKGKGGATGDQKDRSGLFGGKQNEQPQQPQVKTQTVYVNNGGGNTANTNPNAVAYMFLYSADILEVQKILNNTCPSNIGKKIVEDGKLGNETLDALDKVTNDEKGKKHMVDIRATQYVTAEQMKWMKKPCPSSSSNSNPNAPENAAKTNEYLSKRCSELMKIVREHKNRDAKESPSVLGWCGFSNSSIIEWIIALDANQKEFYCSTCNTPSYYSTDRGAWLRYK